jgi:hypothetical protein
LPIPIQIKNRKLKIENQLRGLAFMPFFVISQKFQHLACQLRQQQRQSTPAVV